MAETKKKSAAETVVKDTPPPEPKKRRVRITEFYNGSHGRFETGDVMELPAEVARNFIEHRTAVEES